MVGCALLHGLLFVLGGRSFVGALLLHFRLSFDGSDGFSEVRTELRLDQNSVVVLNELYCRPDFKQSGVLDQRVLEDGALDGLLELLDVLLLHGGLQQVEVDLERALSPFGLKVLHVEAHLLHLLEFEAGVAVGRTARRHDGQFFELVLVLDALQKFFGESLGLFFAVKILLRRCVLAQVFRGCLFNILAIIRFTEAVAVFVSLVVVDLTLEVFECDAAFVLVQLQ